MFIIRRSFVFFALFIFLCSCSSSKNALKQISISKNPQLAEVFKNSEKYELQIIYSRIIRKKGRVEFRDFKYRVDPESYFYPASTVKLPVAVLSLEKINKLNQGGVAIDKNTIYRLKNDTVSHTIARDINAIFAVSDNEAYNRLFEFLGQDYINATLKSKRLAPVRISHRFSGESSADTITKQMIFVTEHGDYELPGTINSPPDSLKIFDVVKGVGYMKDDKKIDEPFSFALKNYFPLETQHNLMKRIFFPDMFEKHQNFQIEDKDMKFLKNAMSSLPREMGYEESEYYDSYGKFFMFGDSKERIPSYVKIYNKVGYAYGTLTETAYFRDDKNDVEFLLSATLLVNENGIFNDNEYEYESLGIPFLSELGRQIYQVELNRNNK